MAERDLQSTTVALKMLAVLLALLAACQAADDRSNATAAASSARPAAAAASAPPIVPVKVERKESAMGTSLHFVAYTSAEIDERKTNAAIDAAIREMRRLEALLSEWKQDSEVGRINQAAGNWVSVGPEVKQVIEKGLWAGKISEGTFDITFQAMSEIWKFGTLGDPAPHVPSSAEVARKRALVDFRKLEIEPGGARVRLPKNYALGLGGIAKGFIVDRAAGVLRAAKLHAFLVQAGGDLYGAGRKPDGSPWVSGIQDPRGPQGTFFATLELEDHAFSTAGDYARSYIVGNRRYHHIIDPRTGYPATASRSVTVWSHDALTADAVDDAVFILGPEKGLKLVESLQGVGVVIVDSKNKVWTSRLLEGRVQLLKPPTDGI